MRVGVIMAYELWGARVILDDVSEGTQDDGENGSDDRSGEEQQVVPKTNSGGAAYSRAASPEKLQATIAWADEIQDLLDKGLIDNHPVREVEGKWDGIMNGLGMLQRGEVRGCKLVIRVSEM